MEPTIYDSFAQYGLLGLVLIGVGYAAWWAMVRVLGENGLLEKQTESLQGIQKILMDHQTRQQMHSELSRDGVAKIKQIHSAILQSLDEIEEEAATHGIDISNRVNRIRDALRDS